jgi:hypothetical protein
MTRHRRDQREPFERLALLQLGVGSDYRPSSGDEFAASGREGFPPDRVQGTRHGFEWGRRGRRCGDPLAEQFRHGVCAKQHLPVALQAGRHVHGKIVITL